MEISIIIVNYNTRALTLKCISSIRKYPPSTAYEIIIIDNGSQEKFGVINDQLMVIKNKKNLGFAKANNQGIKFAKGRYIFLLNSDTEVTEGSISKLYEFAKTNKKIGAVVPKLLNSDGSVQASVFTLPTILNAIKQYWFGQKLLLEKDQLNINYNQKTLVEVAVMAAFMITPICLKKVGNLNEKYYLYFEDLDYCKRIKEARLKIYYLPESEIIHYKGASGGTNKLLTESSKKYHGLLKYYIYTLIIWSGQKWARFFKR